MTHHRRVERLGIQLLGCCLAWIVAVSTGFCDDQSNQPTGIPSIVLKYRDQLYVQDYSAHIDVYEVANSGTGGTRKTFCFLPHPVLDSADLKNAFEALQNSLTDTQKNSTASFSLSVHWTYELDRVEALIADFLKNKYGEDIKASDVQMVPLNAFVVYGQLPDGTQITIKHLPDLQPGVTGGQQVLSAMPEPGDGKFVAPFSDLEAFVNNPALGAHGYVTAAQLTSTAITISGSVFASADFRDQVNGKGGLTQTLNSQTSSSGVGVGIPVIGGLFGGHHEGGSSSESSSINRFVSRNFIQAALESGSAKVAIKSFTDKHNDQTATDVTKQLLSFALENMTNITTRFEQQADGLYKLHSDSLNADLGTGMTLSQIAAATKGDSSFSTNLQHDVTANGVKADDKDELTDSGKSDISWTASGNILVPSTVDLYYASKGQFSQDITAQYMSDEATYSNYTYDAPATVLSSVDGAPLDPEIGTIIASMVPWEAQSAAFHSHYLPADGRSVDRASQYYALINRQRPAGQPDLPQVNLPDLRGEFLRGLNSFDKSIAASSIDPFDQEAGHARTAGERESDAIRRQDLTITSLHNFKHGGQAGDGDHIPITGDPSGYQTIHVNLDKNVNYSQFETRPTNSAVYYYVKVN